MFYAVSSCTEPYLKAGEQKACGKLAAEAEVACHYLSDPLGLGRPAGFLVSSLRREGMQALWVTLVGRSGILGVIRL